MTAPAMTAPAPSTLGRAAGPTAADGVRPSPLTPVSTGPSSAEVRRMVVSRLRRVCAGWPAEQFAALIADVVRFHERWDARDAPAWRP